MNSSKPVYDLIIYILIHKNKFRSQTRLIEAG